MEQAIRTALAKGDATDNAFRQRIYASASAALERSLIARNYSEPEAHKRRQGLSATFQSIESEFVTAIEDAGPEPVSSPQYPNISRSSHIDNALDEAPTRPDPVQNPARAERQHDAAKMSRMAVPRPGRRWLKYALNFGFVLAFIFAGLWAFAEGKRIYADATTPSGQKPVLAEKIVTEAGPENEWVQIFSARDTDLVSAAPGAKVEITSRDGANYVVMSGDSANEVSVKIGSGLVQTFAGKRVLFNIKARSLNGMTLDTGAHCNFGPQTKCERKRFKIGPQSTEYMFAVTLSASATGDGALLIAPDLTGAGGAVEIETIRATIVEPDAG